MSEDNNERAWSLAIEKLNLDEKISSEGLAFVTADELREFREPRLMAKFDKFEDMPSCLRERGWAILGITNSSYAVGHIRTHLSLSRFDEQPTTVHWLSEMDTLQLEDVTNETNAAMIAYHSGVLETFVGEKLDFTHFGRQRSGKYSFSISGNEASHFLEINGNQFEIDAGFEGKNSVVVTEVKLGKPDSLNIRQLYFPFRYWLGKTSKVVIPIFATWSNSRLDLFQISFPFFDDFSSAEVVNHKSYVYKSDLLSIALLETFAASASSNGSEAPFPQANRVDKLIVALNFLSEPKETDSVAGYLGFDPRQASYYLNALAFLGLVSKDKNTWVSKFDRMYTSANQPLEEELIFRMLSVIPVAKTFLHGNRFKRGKFSETEARKFLEMSEWGSSLSAETIARRAQCIVAWCQWIDSKVSS